jgi:hypothetical protein
MELEQALADHLGENAIYVRTDDGVGPLYAVSKAGLIHLTKVWGHSVGGVWRAYQLHFP